MYHKGDNDVWVIGDLVLFDNGSESAVDLYKVNPGLRESPAARYTRKKLELREAD
jgi:hypothetical protein